MLEWPRQSPELVLTKNLVTDSPSNLTVFELFTKDVIIFSLQICQNDLQLYIQQKVVIKNKYITVEYKCS